MERDGQGRLVQIVDTHRQSFQELPSAVMERGRVEQLNNGQARGTQVRFDNTWTGLCLAFGKAQQGKPKPSATNNLGKRAISALLHAGKAQRFCFLFGYLEHRRVTSAQFSLFGPRKTSS